MEKKEIVLNANGIGRGIAKPLPLDMFLERITRIQRNKTRNAASITKESAGPSGTFAFLGLRVTGIAAANERQQPGWAL
ncbi:MAG TPA: hypothetical protein VFB43_21345 [Terracidiphilus sp.]|nr:hypothetical protein [Terracidiphilus sp.]